MVYARMEVVIAKRDGWETPVKKEKS
jgi:hypothetical protein